MCAQCCSHNPTQIEGLMSPSLLSLGMVLGPPSNETRRESLLKSAAEMQLVSCKLGETLPCSRFSCAHRHAKHHLPPLRHSIQSFHLKSM